MNCKKGDLMTGMNFIYSKRAHAISVLSLVLSIYFFAVASGEGGSSFDTWSQQVISNLFGTSSHTFFEIISEFASKQGIGIVALLFICWLWWKKKDYTAMAVFVLAIASGNMVNKYIKDFVGRERPSTAPAEDLLSLSFPSGHAMVGIILYLLIVYFLVNHLNKKSTQIMFGTIIGVLVLLVGISRNVLLAHYPSDVFGGFALGYLWTYVWIIIYEMIGKKRKTTYR